MNDYDEIRNLIARYAHAADNYDADGWADCFAEHGSLTEYGETIVGREKIRELGRMALDRMGTEVSAANKHVQVNSAIDVGGQGASATTDLLVVTLSPDGWRIRGCGVYGDEFVRDEDGRWKISSRTATWTGESGHDPLNPGLAEVFRARFREVMSGTPRK